MRFYDGHLALTSRFNRPAEDDCPDEPVEEGADVPAPALQSGLPPHRSAFDTDRVRQIRKQIASGSYDVDTKALAGKILHAGVLGMNLPKG